MARKDVQLVIRAKDEAATALNSISKAIEHLTDSQHDLSSSAKESDTALTRLGSALAGLDKNLKGLSASNKISQELEKAARASNRLEKSVSETAAESLRLGKALKVASFEADQFKRKSAGAATAQAKQAAALKKAQTSLKKLNASYKASTSERDKLLRADQRLTAQIDKQDAAVAQASTRYAKLAQEIDKTAKPTATLQKRLEASNTALEKQRTKLAGLRDTQAQTRAAIEKTKTSVAGLATELEQSNAAITRQEKVVAKITTNYKNLQVATKSAVAQQTKLDKAADDTATSLARQEASLNRAQVEMQQLSQAAGKANAALTELSAKSGAALEQSFKRQRKAMLETKREWLASTDAARKLASEISRVQVPTREMAESFTRTKAAAAQAKQEYIAQRNGLHQLSGVLKQTGTSVDALRLKQEAFAKSQADTGKALARIRAEASGAAAAYRNIGQATGRAAGNSQRVANQMRQTTTATRGAASATRSLADAYRSLYGESRKAMSWTQRLRGEVISLVAAYGGIYGVIQLLNNTVEAYQRLEGAASRLNVVTDGDQTRVAEELDFVRRNAERLGIEFGALADEYTKFAVATKNTNLEGAKTRKIFISVAEAGRVNKLSLDQMKGVMTALTQIVSKGAVQMEELRQQLGDRLPGAIQLMADGLGVGTAELIKMMEQGQVSSEALVGFSDQLDKVFGPQLGKALQTTTTQIGKFQNAAFQAFLTFGEGGFIESFTGLLVTLNEAMASAEFETFLNRASAGFAGLTDIVGALVGNFDLVVAVVSALIGLQLGKFLQRLIPLWGTLRTQVALARTQMVATNTAMAATPSIAGRAAIAVRTLGLALKSLLASTGIGLAVVAVSTAIGLWSTQADKATAALNSHRKIVDKIKNAYDDAGDSAENWADQIARGSLTQAQANLEVLRQKLQDIRKETKLGASIDQTIGIDNVAHEGTKQLYELEKAFQSGTISAQEFKEAVDELAQQDSSTKDLALEMLEVADKAAEAEKHVLEAEAAIAVMTETASDAQKELLGVGESMEEVKKSFDDELISKTEKFNKAIKSLSENIPALAEEQKLDEKLAEIKLAFDQAAQSAVTYAQLVEAANLATISGNAAVAEFNNQQGQLAFQNMNAGGGNLLAIAQKYSGLNENNPDDRQALTQLFNKAGFDNIDPQMTAWCAAFVNAVLAEGGIKGTGALNARSFLDFGKDAGNSPQKGDIVVFKRDEAGPDAGHVGFFEGFDRNGDILTRGGNQSDGSNVKSYKKEDVLAFRRAESQLEIAKSLHEEEKKRAEAAGEFHEAQAARIEASQFELSIRDQELIQRETAKALNEAELAAKAAGTELTQQERDAIIATTEATYRKQAAEEAIAAVKQRAADAEAEVNRLTQHRADLLERMALYEGSGDTEGIMATETALEEVNLELEKAIQNAQEMWAAVGGAEADTAISKLQTAELKAKELANSARQNVVTWEQVGNMFAGNLVNAFDRFAKSVAEGQNVFEAAKDAFLQFASDFLIQLGQMILKQIIFNAVSSALGGFGLGGSIFHGGGVVGTGGPKREGLHPAVFLNAPRYHGGGIAGLAPSEVPAVLQKGEEVLTENDPRHRANGGGQSGGKPVKIINAFDGADMLQQAMGSKEGEEVIMNYLRDNSAAVKAVIG